MQITLQALLKILFKRFNKRITISKWDGYFRIVVEETDEYIDWDKKHSEIIFSTKIVTKVIEEILTADMI